MVVDGTETCGICRAGRTACADQAIPWQNSADPIASHNAFEMQTGLESLSRAILRNSQLPAALSTARDIHFVPSPGPSE